MVLNVTDRTNRQGRIMMHLNISNALYFVLDKVIVNKLLLDFQLKCSDFVNEQFQERHIVLHLTAMTDQTTNMYKKLGVYHRSILYLSIAFLLFG